MTATDATNAPDRLLALEGSFNFRDLGGYETIDGRRVRWRRLFRADGPHDLTESDARVLGDLGLATVIDLRTADEAGQRGQYRERVGAAVFHHLPMIDVLPGERELAEWTDPAYVGRHYGQMRDDAPGAIAQAFGILAEVESLPAMFHCSAGKDRTGVLAALLLGALGVPDETIVADYALSRDAMDRMVTWLQARATDPETLARFSPAIRSAEPVTMELFLAGMHDRYGTFDGYFATLGLTDTVASLRGALLEP